MRAPDEDLPVAPRDESEELELEARDMEDFRAARPPGEGALERSVGLARVLRLTLGETPAPIHVGRFVVEEKLGEGGMGIVYRAQDPELSRSVAIKLLQPSASRRTTERTLKEARALARLTHPAVVTVFDVGIVGERVYFAMELLEGGTLLEWLAAHPECDAEALVRIFLDVGAGLQAAHEAGLVHGDVKPHNMLMGSDGRPRLIDFGLAIDLHDESLVTQRDASRSGRFASSPTQATGLAGTPAYMAPEQLAGAAPSQAGDQYGFCIALRECLELRAPTGPGAPARPRFLARVEALLERGLDARPAARHPSIADLCEALSRALPRARRRLWLPVGALAVAATVGGWAWVQDRQAAALAPLERCKAQASALESTVEAQLPTLAQSFAALQGGPETLERVRPHLERYTARWAETRVDSCEAAWGDGGLGIGSFEMRIACLDRRREHFESLLEGLAQMDTERLPSVVPAVIALPSIRDCEDTRALASMMDADDTRAPPDPALESRLVRAQTDFDLGARAQLPARLEVLRDEARAAGRDSLFARATLLLTDLDASYDVAQRQAFLREALVAAQRVHDDASAIEAALSLGFLAATELTEIDEAHFWADLAEGLVTRGNRGNAERARVAAVRGHAAMYSMHFAEAAEHFARAAELDTADPETTGPPWKYALNGAQALDMSGHGDEAVAATEKTLAQVEALLGPEHPDFHRVQRSYATMLLGVGRLDESRRIYLESLERLNAVGLAGQGARISVLLNLSELERQAQNLDQAEAHARAALELIEGNEGYTSDANIAYENLTAILEVQGRYEEALDAARKALALIPEENRRNDPQLFARTGINVGVLLTQLQRFEEAQSMLDACVDGLSEQLGEDSGSLIPALSARGYLAVRRGDWAAAQADSERCLALIGDEVEDDPVQAVHCAVNLAEARLEQGDPEQAASALALAYRGEESKESLNLASRAWIDCLDARQAGKVGDWSRAAERIERSLVDFDGVHSDHDVRRRDSCIAWRSAHAARLSRE